MSVRRRSAAVDVVVVGGGHCGLAMSRALSQRSIEHIVLERGEVANAWRAERWDSLRLLTPNWMTRLPGHAYDGDDPDGYMAAPEVADFLSRYAQEVAAPVRIGTTVLRAGRDADGWRIETTQGDWQCRALVVATGAATRPVVPTLARELPAGVEQLTALAYRRPAQLPDGGVLVVGASATGLQLAQEIQRSGRPVTLAVGEHVRMPRLYRGRDIQWWLLAAGMLDQRLEDVDDVRRVRRLPSPQLIGTPDRATLDLNALQQQGVTIVGRLAQVRDGRALFSGSLRNVCALADLKLNRLLDVFDRWALQARLDGRIDAVGPRPLATRINTSAPTALELQSRFRTVIWATGVRPDHSWLDLPVFDRFGELRHAGGIADAPGLYVLGLPFLRRRKSSYIHGAGEDVDDLVVHLAEYLDRSARVVASAHIPAHRNRPLESTEFKRLRPLPA
ncbi:NAD(P)-binding domain-containing protein [Variovorax sp. J22R133]|uniref:NAD(P)-binding domain-containing protein n=1 Tax=Variovorax brevis TaxID=3053503 RepID=UPI0025788C8E|nr:NAD(P)-binding domain-containing protein [Variovorax sp. J22R133]MDM0117736.1 NAD(P)-binding domain-containing protein [Variovorax sp. J22R133]